MAQKHNSYEEKPMTRFGTIQGPSRRYRRLRHPNFDAAEWTAKNPLLQRGEFGIEKDTHRIKAGDGITYWNDLPYIVAPVTTEWGDIQGDIDDQTDLKNALDAKQDVLTAGTNITITGSTISATDTTYTGSDGITLTGTNFTNSGVRSVTTGTSNGTISVNTGGTSAEVAVYGLGSAAYTSSSDYATSAQGSLADTAVQPADLANYVTTNTTQTITGEKVFSGLMNYSAGKTYILAGNGGTKLGYWSYDIDGQSNITLQTMTASTRNINFKTNNGGKVTYNGSEIAKLSDLPGVMTGASAGDAGTSGLVPAPAAGDQGKFLQGDGTWATPTAATAWGNITGTLSDQTDLQSALNAKQDTLTAGSNINISGSTISATDTTYTGSDGITLTGTNFTNSGVRSVATGSTNGTISVNTNGTSADVAVYGLGSAAYTASTDYATSAQGALADTAVQPGDLATVATSGSYNDLLNTPTIPTVNDGTITVTQNGVSVGSFTMNQASSGTIALTDTTYSVMTGATAGDAGTSGLVPTPVAGDQDKYLKGDGTWANPTATTAWGNITGTLSNQMDLDNALKALVPVSTIFPFAGTTVPTGFLLCDGSAVSRTTYADLFAAVGTTYGTGDGSTTFNLPKLNDNRTIRGTSNVSDVGSYSDGKAPNITGGARFGHSGAYGLTRASSGAMFMSDQATPATYGGVVTATGYDYLGIDAARSSTVYDSSFTKIVPNGVAMFYIIKY